MNWLQLIQILLPAVWKAIQVAMQGTPGTPEHTSAMETLKQTVPVPPPVH